MNPGWPAEAMHKESSACARSAAIDKVSGDLLMILVISFVGIREIFPTEYYHVDFVGHVCSGGHPVFIEPYMHNSRYICYPT